MLAPAAVSELIRRCRDGEAAARDQLFARYQHYLYVLAQAQLGKRLGAKCAPSDLVQQTLLEAYRDFAGFHGQHEGELLAWLRRILAHNLFNEVRRYGARQRDADREVSLDQVRAGVDHSSLLLQRCLAASAPSPSEVAQQHESAARLADALHRLPKDYQTVVLLRVFEELPAEEVAQRMGRTAGAVRMLQMRALTALREEMEK
ncbi:MAG TPA: sigma-70 family RNA polymerase sigma factor [Gemmataceae bacterium]|nr:sigma-70 family RNA polymerase sigma factor [Gemmataceae bacterium]